MKQLITSAKIVHVFNSAETLGDVYLHTRNTSKPYIQTAVCTSCELDTPMETGTAHQQTKGKKPGSGRSTTPQGIPHGRPSAGVGPRTNERGLCVCATTNARLSRVNPTQSYRAPTQVQNSNEGSSSRHAHIISKKPRQTLTDPATHRGGFLRPSRCRRRSQDRLQRTLCVRRHQRTPQQRNIGINQAVHC